MNSLVVIAHRGLVTPEDRLIEDLATLAFQMVYGASVDIEAGDALPRYDELSEGLRTVVRRLRQNGFTGQRLRSALPPKVMAVVTEVYRRRLQAGDKYVLRAISRGHN